MEITTFCTVIGSLCHSFSSLAAVLRVLPDRSQFFQYESLSLSCGRQGNFGWRVKKNTSTHVNKDCLNGMSNASHCYFDALYPTDTGVYWCQSAAGECSDAVGITVTRGSVILEGPARPVTEGDDVTLTCRAKTTTSSSSNSSSSLTADFYKDGLLFRRSSTANVTLHAVSEADGGLYRCSISRAGDSPDSWLTVRGHPDRSADACIPLPVVVTVPLLVAFISLMLLCIWRNRRECPYLSADVQLVCCSRVDPDVPYTDVTIAQEVAPQRTTDVEPTFYSTVKPANTSSTSVEM